MTVFPPPAAFTGYQTCEWGDPGKIYKRECTPEEVALLEADSKRTRDSERAEEEALRDSWFRLLRAEEIDAAGGSPDSAAETNR